MPFNRPTLSEHLDNVRSDIDSRLPGADSRLRRSALDVLARTHAGALHGLYGFIDWVSRQILPDTSDGDVLARQAAIWGIRRKAASLATGEVDIAGANGLLVPAGARLVRGDGVEYEAAEETAIAAGVGKIQVRAIEPGRGGNAIFGQPLTFVSPVAGVQATAKVAAGDIGGGSEEEADEALRARLLERIQQPPHGGSQSDYVRWAKEVPGVTRAWVYPGELGTGSVTLRFVIDGRADIVPSAAEVQVVQDHLDPLRPVTAALSVLAPVPRPLDMTIRAVPGTAAVREAILAELEDLVAREAVPGGALLISHIREAVSVAAGEVDHEVIAPAGNVVPLTGELITLGQVSWVGE